MPHQFILFGSTLTVLRDVMAVVGSVAAVLMVIFGIWFALKRRQEARCKREQKDDLEINSKFIQLETSVEKLETATTQIERQYKQLSEHVDQRLRELSEQTDRLKTQTQQQASDLDNQQKELERLTARYEKLALDLQRHRDHVADKFLTVAGYQHDLRMWTTHINSLQSTIKDLTTMLGKRK